MVCDLIIDDDEKGAGVVAEGGRKKKGESRLLSIEKRPCTLLNILVSRILTLLVKLTHLTYHPSPLTLSETSELYKKMNQTKFQIIQVSQSSNDPSSILNLSILFSVHSEPNQPQNSK